MGGASKKLKYLPEARRLYIEDQHNCDEVSTKIPVANQTVWNWKRQDKREGYDWNAERQKFLARKKGLIDETTAFLQDMINQARLDMKEGKDISVGRMYVLKDFIPFLMALQKSGQNLTIPDESEFTGSVTDLIKSQMTVCVQQLYSENLTAASRMKLLKQLASLQKDVQATELEKHMTHIDAKIIAAIIRRFKPDADNDEIIRIYKEESANAKKTGNGYQKKKLNDSEGF